jgi:enoyl-CoA hydratase
MSDSALSYELDGKVTVLEMDDGKANAVSHALISALHAALDRAEKEAHATLLVGRAGKFSAGFDLSVMTAGPEQARGLVKAGAELLMRMYVHPQPIVAACTGHALAAGALLLLASDTRIGAAGDFKVGLNEVSIGLRLPIFGIELARDRLSKRYFTRAAIQGTIFSTEDAMAAGFLDDLVSGEELPATARAEAARLAELPTGALAGTKKDARQGTIDRAMSTLEADLATMGSVSGPGRS